MRSLTETKPRFPELVRVKPEDVECKRPCLGECIYSLSNDKISDSDFHETANDFSRKSATMYTVTEMPSNRPPLTRRHFLIQYF